MSLININFAFSADDSTDDQNKVEIIDEKDDPTAYPDRPSKPYPKNVSPKAFAPKRDSLKEDIKETKLDSVKTSESKNEVTKKESLKTEILEPQNIKNEKDVSKKLTKDKKSIAQKNKYKGNDKAASPQVKQIVKDTVDNNSYGQKGNSYVVQDGDNLDQIIRMTYPSTPFLNSIMREAFVKANPDILTSNDSYKIYKGQVLKFPSADLMRSVLMKDNVNSEEKIIKVNHSVNHSVNLSDIVSTNEIKELSGDSNVKSLLNNSSENIKKDDINMENVAYQPKTIDPISNEVSRKVPDLLSLPMKINNINSETVDDSDSFKNKMRTWIRFP
tara:strand:+ start:1505 stop:2494 length:990 start_codon:yes stop_codon:yes gene_type:complete